MSMEWEQTIVDALDPVALGQWWREALEWVVVNDDPDEFEYDRLPTSSPVYCLPTSPNQRPSRTASTWTSGQMTGIKRWSGCLDWAPLGQTWAKGTRRGSS